MVFGRPYAMETYCRHETDPIAVSRVTDFVAGYEMCQMAEWRMAAEGKTPAEIHAWERTLICKSLASPTPSRLSDLNCYLNTFELQVVW